MLIDNLLEGLRHMIERAVPIDLLAIDLRVQQAPLLTQGLGQCRALGAELAEVGGVRLVAAYADLAIGIDADLNTAAHPAIGTGSLA